MSEENKLSGVRYVINVYYIKCVHVFLFVNFFPGYPSILC